MCFTLIQHLEHVYAPYSRHDGATIPLSIIDWLHKSSGVNAAAHKKWEAHRRRDVSPSETKLKKKRSK